MMSDGSVTLCTDQECSQEPASVQMHTVSVQDVGFQSSPGQSSHYLILHGL